MQLIYLTTVELNALRAGLEQALAYKGDKFFQKIMYGSFYPEKTFRINKLILLYSTTLATWEQYQDGTTGELFNYITREEFTNIVNESKKILAYNL